MQKVRTVVYYKDYYFKFYGEQSLKVKKKLIWTIDLIEQVEQIPKEYFKHIEDSIRKDFIQYYFYSLASSKCQI